MAENCQKPCGKSTWWFLWYTWQWRGAIGTGIFISTVTFAIPLSVTEWELCNPMPGRFLLPMADLGGPRYCARVAYISLIEAGNFLKERMSVQLDIPENIECKFFQLNEAQFLQEKCSLYS